MEDRTYPVPVTDGVEIVGAIIYGPPRSRRGRFMNWIRRRLRREEQDEAYAWIEAGDGGTEEEIVGYIAPEGLLQFDDGPEG